MEIVASMLGQLGINGSIFVMLGIFVLTYFLLSFMTLRKLSATLIERENRTEGRAHEAHHLSDELSELRAKITSSTQEARMKANTEFLMIRSKALEEQRTLVNKAREAAGADLKKTRATVAQQFDSEIAKLEQDIPKISKSILDKILDTQTSARSKDSALTTELE